MERRIEVPVLDATAIGVSIFRSDFSTASSIMFLLGIGELLEEWTHKKSVDDLARTMSLNVGKVWLKTGDQTVLVSSNQIKSGDQVVVHMGNVIPFDGEVVDGEAMINQASLTGESVPVRRTTGNYVYAGTVVEEGEVTVDVKAVGGSSRYEKIAAMIEESEKLKSGLESRAEHLADKLVPYSLGGTALTYLLTRNATKALSVLMVDFSCALKLAMPIIVGIAIAFIINVPMKQIERKIFNIDKRKHKKFIRLISLTLSVVLIFGILGLILFLIIPEVIEAVGQISRNLPSNFNWVNDISNKAQELYPGFKDYIKNIDVKNILSTSGIHMGNIVNVVVSFLSSTISKIVMFFFGFIIAIYILADKENLARQTKKLLKAFMPDKVSNEVVRIVKLTNVTFTKFLTGQCLDSALTGFEFFIILSIIKVPYALILGVLFAVTALIPYVGAFITLVVGALLVAVSNPINALWYTIAFFALQQFDDNFTYPKIVGKSVGLPALWALVAVLIGGSIFGFVGMIISIPISSVLYTLLIEYVNYKIEKKCK